MKLVRVNPAYSLNAMDRLLNDFFQDGLKYDRLGKNETQFQPATNIYELDDAVKIELQIPGFSKEQVKIMLDKDVLQINGEVGEASKDVVKSSRIQFKRSNFEKKFKLTEEVDRDKIGAAFDNGILILTLPKVKAEPQVVRKIEIA